VKTIKPIIKQLQKSVKSHDKQAKQLTKDISDEKGLEEQAKELEEQLKTAEKELEELYIKEDKAYVIRFKRIKDKERMVVVFRNQNDADMYADNIKKQGGQVFSNKLEKIPYKVVDKKSK
jgi:DNA repair exonuclease SbcCD ATPase subunit